MYTCKPRAWIRGTQFQLVTRGGVKITALENGLIESGQWMKPSNPSLWGGPNCEFPISVRQDNWRRATGDPVKHADILAEANRLQTGCIYMNERIRDAIARQTAIAAYHPKAPHRDAARAWLRKVCVPYGKRDKRKHAAILPDHLGLFGMLLTDITVIRKVLKRMGRIEARTKELLPELAELEAVQRKANHTRIDARWLAVLLP